MSDHADTIRFEDALLALCLELPAPVYDDFKARADALLAERQQLQEQLDAALATCYAAGKESGQLMAERQQAIDALREIAASHVSVSQQVARDALVKLGEQR